MSSIMICGDPAFPNENGVVQWVLGRLLQRLKPELALVVTPRVPMAGEFLGLMGVSVEPVELPKNEWPLRPWGKGRDAPDAIIAFAEMPDELTSELLGRGLRWKVPGVYLVDGEDFMNVVTGEIAPCG